MKLSVFVGGFHREAAAEVAEATLPVLASLVDKSLLRVTANGRYDSHPLLYQFVREKLEDSAYDSIVTQQKHTDCYCYYLISQSDAIVGPQQQTVIKNLDLELGNIYEAWPHFFEDEINDNLYIAVNAICEYMSIRGLIAEGIKLCESALTLLKQQSLSIHVACLKRNLGWLFLETGDLVKAQEHSERGLALLFDLNYPLETALALTHLGNIYLSKGDFLKAEEFYKHELRVRESVEHSTGMSVTLHNLGYLYTQMGRYSEAERCMLDSLNLGKKLNNPDGLAASLENLGSLYLSLDRLEEAEDAFCESLALSQKIGYERLVPYILNGLGNALYRQGKLAAGETNIREALNKVQGLSDEVARVALQTSYAHIKTSRGDYAQAQELLVQAIETAHRLDLKLELLDSTIEAVQLFVVQGYFAQASLLAHWVVDSPVLQGARWQRAQELLMQCDKALSNTPARGEPPLIAATYEERRGSEQMICSLLTAIRGAQEYSAALPVLADSNQEG